MLSSLSRRTDAPAQAGAPEASQPLGVEDMFSQILAAVQKSVSAYLSAPTKTLS